MARKVKIPQIGKGSKTVESIDTLFDGREIRKSFGSKTVFRARRIRIQHNGSTYIVQIARPIENLKKEIRELSIGVSFGFVFSLIVLVVLSRFLSSLMLKMKDDKLPPLLLNSLNRMNTQILRMERLVKDLLKLASLEIVPTGDFNSVDMTGLMNSLIDDYLYVIKAHGIEADVNIPVGLNVQGDDKLLRRDFSNILDNAVKYNETCGRIKISTELSSSEVSISIGNAGPGVAAAELHSVFDQFYRGEKSRSLQYGGSGLGLAAHFEKMKKAEAS